MYENEREVGRGLKESGVPREEVFLTTKLWLESLTRSAVPRSFEGRLRLLDTDYVDLLLIHWPSPRVPVAETVGAMECLRESGKARSLGVSNFTTSLWREALEHGPVRVNQVEFHPFLDQSALVSFARKRSLELVAYTPLAKGRVADDATIVKIAEGRGKTPAQVALRFLIQQGPVAAIPKSSRREHLEENLDVFDLELSSDEMRAISGLARNLRLVNPPWAPDWDSVERRA